MKRTHAEQNSADIEASVDTRRSGDLEAVNDTEAFPTLSRLFFAFHPRLASSLRYGSVIACVALAVCVRFLLQGVLGGKAAYVTFFPALIYAA